MAAKKKDVMLAFGVGGPGSDDDSDSDYDFEGGEDKAASDQEAAEDEAIDTFLDDSNDIDTRREAFRKAVKLCTESY